MNIIHISFAGPYWKIDNPSGKHSWIFEMHRFCGPMLLKFDASSRDYVPADRIWSERSQFWKIFQCWIDQGQQMDSVNISGLRLCKYDLESK